MAEAESKSKTEYTPVVMTDGRTVQFAGKKKLDKTTVIDTGKIDIDEASGLVQMAQGAVSIRLDFRNGETRTFSPPLALYAKFLGHGGEQKLGDNLAASADKPLTEDDMVMATDELMGELAKGNWGKSRAEGGGATAGAGIVVQAIMEATGKDAATVKAYLDKKIAATEGLTRPALYASFRVEGTKTGEIIKRLEAGKIKKAAKVDADAALAEV